jgi:cytidylate kinase
VKEIVTLSGDIGGGKSSVARILSASLGYPIISAGGMQREIATSMGLTTLQLNEQSAKDRSVDDRIDAYTKMLGETRDHIIVDSRLAWHFIPPAFKVFLSVDPLVGAERVFGASRSEEHHHSLEHAVENNRSRTQLETTRFRALYGIELRDYRNYDLIVDTSYVAPETVALTVGMAIRFIPETVAATIEQAFAARNRGQAHAQVWMCPQRLAAMADALAGAGGRGDAAPVTLQATDGQFVVVSGREAIAKALAQGVALVPASLT